MKVLRLGALGALLLIAGCGGQAEQELGGQTVAIVNGEPITSGDIDLELSLMSPDARAGARAAVVQALIDRKLLVQEARARGMESSRAYVQMERRNREMLLAQFANEVVSARSGRASEEEVKSTLLRRPELGSERRLWTVTVVRFPMSPALERVAVNAPNMGVLQRELEKAGVPDQPLRVTWDSATIAPALATVIDTMQPGQMSLRRSGGYGVAIQLLQVRPMPYAITDAEKAARSAIIADKQAEALARHRAALRAGAKIVLSSANGKAR